VNPKGSEIFGEHVYPSLEEIDAPVDVVDVFRPPAEAETIAQLHPLISLLGDASTPAGQ
jgi:predicted CoA-binding protein